MVWLIAGVVSLAVLAGIALLAPRLAQRTLQREEQRAIQEFRHRREVLEARFFELASATGKPRGLRWKYCDWKDAVRFAREVESGEIAAFAAVEIHFEAIAGSDMEDVAAVGDVRDASAVFHCHEGQWGTGGKALFNMAPELAVERLAGQYTPLRIAGNESASARMT